MGFNGAEERASTRMERADMAAKNAVRGSGMELRKDPITQSWVIQEYEQVSWPDLGACPLCPGLLARAQRAGAQVRPTNLLVFLNDPALGDRVFPQLHSAPADGVLRGHISSLHSCRGALLSAVKAHRPD